MRPPAPPAGFFMAVGRPSSKAEDFPRFARRPVSNTLKIQIFIKVTEFCGFLHVNELIYL